MVGISRAWMAAVAVAVAALGARAADNGSTAARAPQNRRTVLHFGEDDIRGDLTRPDGELVQAPRKVAESSLLRVRRNFLDRALAASARGQ
jgi:hypothetical protein